MEERHNTPPGSCHFTCNATGHTHIHVEARTFWSENEKEKEKEKEKEEEETISTVHEPDRYDKEIVSSVTHPSIVTSIVIEEPYIFSSCSDFVRVRPLFHPSSISKLLSRVDVDTRPGPDR